MKRVGVITVARWMAEQLPNGVMPYMVVEGDLYRLKHMEVFNGVLRPTFAAVLSTNLFGEFSRGDMDYTLQSPVYLSMENLAGDPVNTILGKVDPVDCRCWVLRNCPSESKAFEKGAHAGLY